MDSLKKKPYRWLIHVVLRSLAYRKGRSFLLLLVLGLASALVAALAIISDAADRQVAEEVRKYGANVLIVPQTGTVNIGSGALAFGTLQTVDYLPESEVLTALAKQKDEIAGYALLLKGVLPAGNIDVEVHGVDFRQVKSLFPWWQLAGGWPQQGEVIIGTDLAIRLRVKAGDTIPIGNVDRVVSAVLATGGEEDEVIVMALPDLQHQLGLSEKVSEVRVLVTQHDDSLAKVTASLTTELPHAQVRELRQVAKTSETFLAKVKLLMLLVTIAVVVSCAGSVASTMSTTVLERRKEIGLLKALGASRLGVVAIFTAEALTFSVAGGLAGFAAGMLFAAAVLATAFGVSGGWAPHYLPISLLTSILLALVGSIGPLLSVYKLDPVDSLRGE